MANAEDESRARAEGAPAPAGEGPGGLRASHADRDNIVEVLRVAAGDGRLSPEELDERLEKALTARTYDELAALTADLPPVPGAAYPALAGQLAAQPRVKDVLRIQRVSGHARRDGRWAVPPRIEVRLGSGSVVLDFTRAVITAPVVQLDAELRSGHLLLITRPGIVVDADEVTVRTGHVQVRQPWGEDVPVELRIEVTGELHSGHILARPPRPPRRTLWQWLRRAPRRPALGA